MSWGLLSPLMRFIRPRVTSSLKAVVPRRQAACEMLQNRRQDWLKVKFHKLWLTSWQQNGRIAEPSTPAAGPTMTPAFTSVQPSERRVPWGVAALQCDMLP